MSFGRLKRVFAAFMFCIFSALGSAQMLARPGWSGNGMVAEPWWKQAVIYEIYPSSFQDANGKGDLKGITQRLDYLQSMNVDAIAISPMYVPVQAGAGYTTIDPQYGTMEDFDALMREAGRRNIRVLLGMDLDPAAIREKDALESVHFWLNHGVAGFELYASTVPAADVHGVLRDFRKMTDAAVGQRMLVGETSAGTAAELAKMYGHGDELQLAMDTQLAGIDKLDVSAFRTRLTEAETQLNGNEPLFYFDNPDKPRSWGRFSAGVSSEQDKESIARILATVLLTTHASAQIYYGQEIGMSGGERFPMPWERKTSTGSAINVASEESYSDSLLYWYRKLIALRRSNTAMHMGSTVMLNHDSQNALVWMRKPARPSLDTPAVVIACNFSAQPVTLSLKAEMKSNGVRGSFLRTLVRTDHGMGPMDLDALHLAPYGVYIGEVRY
jgi:alpha-glucosidase